MEKRKITVVSDKKTSPVTFESSATTLGELKRELDAMNINYSNSEFTEGNSALRLINDNSELPKEVKRRLTGQMTNHLVISIKTINKRLNQGGHKPTGAFHRTVVNAIVKYNPELKDMIIDKFGCNYTQVSSEPLCQYLIETGYFKEGMPTGKIDVNEYVSKNPDYFKKQPSASSVVVGGCGLTEHIKDKKDEDEKTDGCNNSGNEHTSQCKPVNKKQDEPAQQGKTEIDTKSIIAYLKSLNEEDRTNVLAEINGAFVDEAYSPDEIRDILNSIG